MPLIAGSIKATVPASHKLAPVITVTTVIAITMCPIVYMTARVTLLPAITFFKNSNMPNLNSVISPFYIVDVPNIIK